MTFISKKEKTALFVDLTNFYSQLIKSKINSPKNLRDYFMYWFEFVSLSSMLTNEVSDVWVFYSGEKIGPEDARITNKHMSDLIKKLNQQKGVTCYNVNISGEQREPFKAKCQSCGCEADTYQKSEKGVDSSLIVHLFDTMNSWDKAYLLSGDADFVPAVKSLRRMGKVVNGAGFVSKTSSALIRECFDYIDLENFFRYDCINKFIFEEDGLISKFFEEMIPGRLLMKRYKENTKEEISLSVSLSYKFDGEKMHLLLTSPVNHSNEWKKELKKVFRYDGIYEDDEQEEYHAYIDYHFKDVVIKHLKLIANKLQLKSSFDENYEGFDYSCDLLLVWDKEKETYVKDTKHFD